MYPSACIILFGSANGGGNYGVFYSVYNGMMVMVTSIICFHSAVGCHVLHGNYRPVSPEETSSCTNIVHETYSMI
jgi:hypothetical protein